MANDSHKINVFFLKKGRYIYIYKVMFQMYLKLLKLNYNECARSTEY